MIIRYLIFIIIVIFAIFATMIMVKDTGQERKKIEKRIKLNADEKLRESQEVWRRGPQKRK